MVQFVLLFYVNKFASRLKELRTEKGLTREQLAKKLDISIYAVQHWEHNFRTPHIDVIISIAQFFGVTVGQMVGTEEL